MIQGCKISGRLSISAKGVSIEGLALAVNRLLKNSLNGFS